MDRGTGSEVACAIAVFLPAPRWRKRGRMRFGKNEPAAMAAVTQTARVNAVVLQIAPKCSTNSVAVVGQTAQLHAEL